MTDWFRSPDWNEEAQREFEVRLARARASGRAQYLRIKSVALRDAGNRPGAAVLLVRIIEDHADQWTEVAFAHECLGHLFRSGGEPGRAEAEYRLALTVSPSLSGTTGEVHVKLAEVLFESGAAAMDEVDGLLAEAKSHVTLNSSVFRVNVLEARVAQAKGEITRRRTAAAAALALVDADAQFKRHPTVGRVDASPSLIAELNELATV